MFYIQEKILKIKPKFFEMLASGKKTFDVRKMNKYKLAPYSRIKFVDYETGKELGTGDVESMEVGSYDFIYNIADKETKQFMEENYEKDKYYLMIFFDIHESNTFIREDIEG